MVEPLFFILRHGATASNADNCYRGWSNGPEAQLSPEGREGVRESCLFLKDCGYKFPLIICDDLDRAQETAKIAASILDIREIETVPGMKPLNVGDFTGKSKADFPIEPYLHMPDKKIPGGESHNDFDQRMAKVFSDVLELIEKIKHPILIIGHGSTVSFLHNHMTKRPNGEVGYEGLVLPSGVLVFTEDGVIPLIKKRQPVRNPYKDGTRVAGFVTDEENKPPRECWNCRYASKDTQTGLLGCGNLLVRIDPELKDQRQNDGTVSVGERDCCDMFRNKIAT